MNEFLPVQFADDNPSLARSEMVMGEQSECSILSSQLAHRAQELLNRPSNASPAELLVWDSQANDFAAQSLDTVAVSPSFRTAGGRDITLYLGRRAKAPDDMHLLAVTRGDVAFQVGRFARQPGSIQCDYFQIGDEINDESIIVTPKDEHSSRKDIVEATHELLNYDAKYVALIEQARADYSTEAFEKIVRNSSRYTFVMNQKVFIKEGARLLAVLELDRHFPPGRYHSHADSDIPSERFMLCDLNIEDSGVGAKKAYLEAKQQLDEFFEQPNFQTILDRKLLGWNLPGRIDAMASNLLILETARKLNITGDFRRKASDLAKLVNLDETINGVLGEYDCNTEEVIAQVGELAVGGRAVRFGLKLKSASSKVPKDAEYEVEAQPVEPAVDRVMIGVRPASQPDQPFAPLFAANGIEVDRRQPLPFGAEDAVEVSFLLGKALGRLATEAAQSSDRTGFWRRKSKN